MKMSMLFSTTAIILVLTILACLWFYRRQMSFNSEKDINPGQQLDDGDSNQKHLPLVSNQSHKAERFVVRSGNDDVISVSLIDDDSQIQFTKKDINNPLLAQTLLPLTQTIPALAMAHETHSKYLMEVVVNGDLIRASDGNGWRAMTIGDNGIQDHARLFEPSSLQHLASAALAWQLVSVLVGQKHLGEINKALNKLDAKIDDISTFLNDERAARIQANFSYIRGAARDAERGQLSIETRTQLEAIDRELDGFQIHLHNQAKRIAGQPLTTSYVGCDNEYNSAISKQEKLSAINAEMAFCMESRLAGWYVSALHPRVGLQLDHRFYEIQSEIKKLHNIKKILVDSAENDMGLIDGITSAKVINERRRHVARAANSTIDNISESYKRHKDLARKVKSAIKSSKDPARLLIEVKDQNIIGVYRVENKI